VGKGAARHHLAFDFECEEEGAKKWSARGTVRGRVTLLMTLLMTLLVTLLVTLLGCTALPHLAVVVIFLSCRLHLHSPKLFLDSKLTRRSESCVMQHDLFMV
jgi:hypothetical protein